MIARGMTLIELVVVLAILVALSGAVVAMTDKVDQDARHQESCRRLAAIRRAVLGPEAVTAGGGLVWGGFLQDMGRLPRGADLADLLVQGDQPSYAAQTRCGWRGPYVTRLPGRASKGEDKLLPSPRLYDDWGDDIASTTATDGTWTLASSFDPDRPRLSLAANEWRLDLAPFTIHVLNRSGLDFSGASRQIRFALQGAQDGVLTTLVSGSDGTLDARPGDICGLANPFPGRTGLAVGRYRLVMLDATTGLEFPDLQARTEVALSPRIQPDDPVQITLIRLAL